MANVSHELLDLQAALAGEYSLERELGRGGMGVVYLARDVQLDRLVAIKVLPTHLATDVARERFLREARTAAKLSHPNIVPIHRVGETNGFVYFVMSYVAGQTLGERLRNVGPLPAADAVRLMREVAWALAYAHGRGVVHRDIKPDNILIEAESGRAMVTDFGIARVDDTVTSSSPGTIMGTAQFMSPEQATGEAIDGRSDLYSLGVVGYMAVSGRLPFEAPNVPALLLKQATQPAAPVSDVAPGIPQSLARAIDRCLQKNPADRFANGEDLSAALAPTPDHSRELPAPLRNWLGASNPVLPVYGVWAGVTGLPLLYELGQLVQYRHVGYELANMLILLGIAAAPLIPMIGYHVNAARRLFHAGFTLADLRRALNVAAQERGEDQTLAMYQRLRAPDQILRGAAWFSLGAGFVLTFMHDVIVGPKSLFPLGTYIAINATAWIAAGVLLVTANMHEIPVLPAPVRRFFRTSLRERLWRSRLGEWIAKRLGTTRAQSVDMNAFRPTEVALGAAATDLFCALPPAYREQLASLPKVVSALEQHAIAAREVEASAELGRAVAALESIRLGLLRLHAGASNLAPLTTLLEEAQEVGADLTRLSEAQREVDRHLGLSSLNERRVTTPTG